MTDHLADALNRIKTHERVGQNVCSVKSTKLIKEVLEVLRKRKYLENIADEKGGYYRVTLGGRINDCGVIKPRMPVKRNQWAEKEQRYIPGFGVGLLIVSTPRGVMTNSDAEELNIGGRLLAYVY